MTENHTVEADWYNNRLLELRAKPNPTEADVCAAVVRPVLERVLKFGVSDIDEQAAGKDKLGRHRRPDFICRTKHSAQAALIVEVKNLGVDLTRRASTKWESAPVGQLESYLRGRRDSGDGTWGIVTNGREWIVTRRQDDDVPLDNRPVEISTLAEVEAALVPIIEAETPQAKLEAVDEGDWLEWAGECDTPDAFLEGF